MPGNGAPPSAIAMAKPLGLRYVSADALSIRRRRAGNGWSYIGPDGEHITDPKIVRRLTRLAVPPAYRHVLYATDPTAHLQAIGRDAAGRLQYRYHPRWEDVREGRKARRLAQLAEALRQLPGRRLFQHRTESGTLRCVTAREVNAFLREITGAKISLKDFRTLMASASVLEALARIKPAPTARARRKQVLEAISAAAENLANTPAICRQELCA